MYELDAAVTHAINSVAGSNALIDLVMIWASIIGVPLLVLAVAGQWWRRGDRQHTRHVLIAAGLSFLLGLALNQLVLLFVHRMRPYDAGVTHLLLASSVDPSFPLQRRPLPSQPPSCCIRCTGLGSGSSRPPRW